MVAVTGVVGLVWSQCEFGESEYRLGFTLFIGRSPTKLLPVVLATGAEVRSKQGRRPTHQVVGSAGSSSPISAASSEDMCRPLGSGVMRL